jgi:hypothetical protein
MIVDNYWHLHHSKLGNASWANSDSDFLGDFDFEAPVMMRAPPLPICIALTADKHLSHPIQDLVPSFQDYRLADLVVNGADGDYLVVKARMCPV